MKKAISSFVFGKGQKRGSRLLASTALTAAGLMAFASPAFAVDDLATPIGENVVGGAATFDRPELGQLNINQSTDRVIINWDSFNIGQNASTTFYQPGAGSIAVNRVTGKNDDPTQILGSLRANGRVVVLDRNGVIFGHGSRVDTAGIVASTGDINDEKFMDQTHKFELSNFGDGAIVNNGMITANAAGLVAFVGKNVANNGVINAKVGKVALAAGDTTATLDLYGDGLVEFAVDGAKGKVLASNSGTINAEGGTVAITANAAKDVVDNVINMDGIINVSSVTQKGGKIILGGGKGGIVKVSGNMTASGKTGGGDIKVTGKNVEVTSTSVITNNAGETGNGGNTYIYGDDYAVFSGRLAAQGGSVSGNGGQAEISAGKGVGYYGLVDLSSSTGTAGTLLIDPEYLTISTAAFSGDLLYFLSLTNLGTVNINDQALANTLRYSNVNLWATEELSVTTDIDVSTWEQDNYTYSFPFCIFGCYAGTTFGVTNNDLTLSAPTVNLTNDIILGTGKLNVNDLPAGTSVLGFGIVNVPAGGIQVDTINLNGIISRRETVLGATTIAGDDQINSEAETINVESNNAKIQQAIYLSDDDSDLTTINVDDGTYAENLIVNKNNIKLQSVNGRASTIIQGTAGVGALGSVLVTGGVHDLQIGDLNKGFTINGFDNGNPGIENAALYFQGTHNDIKVIGNEIVADGDEALLTEYGQANTNFVIDSNKFSGKTYVGAVPNTGDQFVDPNVSRQLVALNLGHTNLTFTNNEIVGDAGFNQLVALQSTGATVSGNDFDGNTTSASLRVRGSNIDVFNNTIDGNGGGYGIWAQNVAGLLIGENGANTVDNTGRNGIQIEGGSGVTKVNNNEIGLLGGFENIKGDGIFATDVNGIELKKNKIQKTKSTANDVGSGIHVQKSNGAIIEENKIDNTGWDGVRVYTANNATVTGNDIDDVFRTGVYFGYASNAKAIGNFVDGAGRYGINAIGGATTTITKNDIDNTGLHGINLIALSGTNIVNNNTIDTTTNGDGIHADTVTSLRILDNKVGLAGGPENIKGDGIYAQFADGVFIQGNEISNTKSLSDDYGSGIHVQKSNGALVDDNTISNTGWDGVRVYNATNATVTANDIDDVFRTGVYFGYVSNAKAIGNFIDGAGRYGVNAIGGAATTITGNDIDNTGLHGINLIALTGTNLVDGNFIDTTTNGDGIHADTVTSLTIEGNEVGLAGGAENIKGDGIYAQFADGVIIQDNEIANTKSMSIDYGSGVHVQRSSGALIDGNKIGSTGWDGVRVYAATNATVSGNDIDDVYRTGVYFGYVSNANAIGNFIDDAGRYGINAIGGGTTTLTGNDIDDTGLHGINLIALTGPNLVNGNFIDTTGQDGIHADTVTNLVIDGNEIGLTGGVENINGDGIYAEKVDGAVVKKNTIQNTRSPVGNKGSGVHIQKSSGVMVGGTDPSDANLISNMGWDGVRFHLVNNSTIQNNDIDDVGRTGIYSGYGSMNDIIDNLIDIAVRYGVNIDWGNSTDVVNNEIADTGFDGIIYTNVTGNNEIADNEVDNAGPGYSGLKVAGNGNGTMTVSNNVFTDNEIGATFESGLIVLTGVANKFINGEVGMRFDGGLVSLVDPDGGVNSLPTEAPANYGGTIGAQIFEGQGQYYVELLNGAFANTWVDGRDSSYDGFTPLSSILSPADYALLTPMFWDWNNDNGLGRFWGLASSAAAIDQQNIFEEFGPFAAIGGQVNVVLLGMPRLAGGPTPGPTAFDPNAIEPQAGGDGTETASMSPEELNNIQTAAGGEGASSSSCWMDASAAATGGSATFSFSSVINQTTLAQETSCGSAQPQ